MGVSNVDGMISDSRTALKKDNRKNARSEMQDALMKVMTKIFSAKVVVVRLPDIDVIKKEIDDEKDNFELEETNGSQTPALKGQSSKEFTQDMFTKSCQCNDKLKGEVSHNHCQNCKHRFTFKCKKCNQKLSSYVRMQRHLLSKCKFQGYYFVCPDCPFQSVFRFGVEIHIKKSHPNGRKDGIKIITNEDLRTDFRKYTCATCNDNFRYKKALENHIRTCYSELQERVFDKSYENDSLGIEDSLLNQIPDRLLIRNKATFYCSACDKQRALKDYKALEGQICPDCDENLLFKCSKCNHSCKTYTGMICHLRTKCAVQKNFKCSQCKYVHPMRRTILLHYQRVHEARAVKCPRCKLKLKNETVLKSHLTYCNKKPYLSCTFGKCSFVTNNPVTLKCHTDRHVQTDNTDCPKCQKKFKNRVAMKNHLFSCGREPGFFCDNCPYVSKQKRDLQTHMLRKHLREINNDYMVCPKCDVAFTNKKYNKGHLRLCKTSTPHVQCKYCYYMIEQVKKKLFVLHMRRVHPENLESNTRKSRRRMESGQDDK